jgi:hypothetical protein
MADPIVSFITENDDEFKKLLDDVGKDISDFRIPFGLISNHFYRGNRKIFSLRGPGLYPDLGGFKPSEKIKVKGVFITRRAAAKFYKNEEVGFIYPLLKRTGKLEASLSSRNGPNAEHFIGRNSLVMGTKVDYAKYHQSDRPRTRIPQRKMIFIDGGGKEVAKDAIISGRLQAWTNIINDYVVQVLTGRADL